MDGPSFKKISWDSRRVAKKLAPPPNFGPAAMKPMRAYHLRRARDAYKNNRRLFWFQFPAKILLPNSLLGGSKPH
jgi:hypothetical protein